MVAEFCGPHEAQHGLGWSAVEHNMLLYMDDIRIAGRDHIWVQDTLALTVVMFKRVSLETYL